MRLEKPKGELRRGWTTGACATAATKAAATALVNGTFPDPVSIVLPKGETPSFPLAIAEMRDSWARAGIVKDAGDDPDVTHGCTVIAAVRRGPEGIRFKAGNGVGTVTKPGLPVAVGEPAINPKPREMMLQVLAEVGITGADVEISIPGGEALAAKTWNPRLGIEGGLSILGTTGIVHPFSCAAWIASIHRGVDVARAAGLSHIAGCTGSTSEDAVRAKFGLPLEAMIDMGDFAGGLLSYVRSHPVHRLTIGGGFGKIAKLAQGAVDLHSGRSRVDFEKLSELVPTVLKPRIAVANTALEALELAGEGLAKGVAALALSEMREKLRGAPVIADVVIVSRDGAVLAHAS